MSDLTTTRGEATAALAQLGDRLAAAKTIVTSKRGELESAEADVAAISRDHATVTAMLDAGKIVAAAERVVPALEADMKGAVTKVEASPFTRYAVGGSIVAVVILVALIGFWPHLPH